MFKTTVGPERERLGFKQAVLSAFSFLVQDYGFRCVATETTFVRYESRLVFINIYHGRASYELGAEIGKLSRWKKGQALYHLGAIMDLLGVREKEKYMCFQVSTPEGVAKFVPRLAELVRRYAVPALLGDSQIFCQLHEASLRRAQQYERQEELVSIRQRADEAWEKKDYPLVVRLYRAIQDDELTRLEKWKINYAQKKAPQPLR